MSFTQAAGFGQSHWLSLVDDPSHQDQRHEVNDRLGPEGDDRSVDQMNGLAR